MINKRSAMIFGLPALLLLPACSLFDNSDPREGEEGVEQCAERMRGWDAVAKIGETDPTATYVPTYTYDITKMGLEDIQALTGGGGDETAGSRGMASTNEEETAVSRFMEQPVDEKGAFFLGRDPALYRVRGQAQRFDQIIRAGCERQQDGMRLTSVSLDLTSAPPADSAPADSDNENDN
ncbi:hypothetical protein ACI5KX_09505 [Erythrobacter sp. GH1-10]|uniref:hypothetical protein n=1 Tax=Erythrobacter sp. GH1-10 TaxID=3349334 RepID=UPI003877FB26